MTASFLLLILGFYSSSYKLNNSATFFFIALESVTSLLQQKTKDMKLIITATLLLITFLLSIFGIKKGENTNSVFHEKHQFINVQTKIDLRDEVKK